MAYICYKPAGSCKTCPHFRWDEDRERMACWAKFDEEKEMDNNENKKNQDATT